METIAPLTMPLEDAMRTQRAIRRLKTDPVDDALLQRLIELALKAPTGSNAQNWEFIVVRDRAVKEKLGDLNMRAFRLYGGLGRRVAKNDPKMLQVLDAVQWQADHFAEIPVVVVACLKGGMRFGFPPIAPVLLLRLDLPVGPEPAPRCPRGRSRRRAHHAAALEHVRGAPHPRLSVGRAALRGDPARLAAREVRPDDAPAGGRGGVRRPLREPRVARTVRVERGGCLG